MIPVEALSTSRPRVQALAHKPSFALNRFSPFVENPFPPLPSSQITFSQVAKTSSP